MKVHPAMLMKTKEGRFQVPGVRCQGAALISDLRLGDLKLYNNAK
jgi:hypothetical protein